MKKSITLLFIIIFASGCTVDSGEDIFKSALMESEKKLKMQESLSFEDWDHFHKVFMEFSNLSMEELQVRTYFSYEKNMEISPALQGILNNKNEFKVGGNTIWFNDGKFYIINKGGKKAFSKKSKNDLEIVGSVVYENLGLEEVEGESKMQLGMGNIASFQHRFWKQRYVENCGNNGVIQGPSPREFKYVNELYAEYLQTGYQYNYILHLRVKLEYNHKGSSWRLSGEGREISINVTDKSTLMNPWGGAYPDRSGNPSPFTISYSASCVSHQDIVLRSYYDIAPIAAGSYWNANASGTIIQKMYGDVESNRWSNYANWTNY